MRLADIDKVKCPNLYRAVERSDERRRQDWAKVVELRQAGQMDSADQLVRKLLGVEGPPMTEETKEKLRMWNEEHKEEIKERKKQAQEVRKRTLAKLGNVRRKA